MNSEELKTVTLDTTIYHPFFGEGKPIKITKDEIVVEFSDGSKIKFRSYGSKEEDKFLSELFLYPVYIVRKP